MIASFQHGFVFIKTSKTAGTSLEVFLANECGKEDIVTPIYPTVRGHRPRNFHGTFNPLPEWRDPPRRRREILRDAIRFRKYYNHIPARIARRRLGHSRWESLFTFAVERNPWDKTISHLSMLRATSEPNLSLDQYFHNGRFCRNLHMYTDDAGAVIVDRLLRYENLSVELAAVFQQVGIPFGGSLEASAKSSYRPRDARATCHFTAQQLETIRSVFRDEIDLMDYWELEPEPRK